MNEKRTNKKKQRKTEQLGWIHWCYSKCVFVCNSTLCSSIAYLLKCMYIFIMLKAANIHIKVTWPIEKRPFQAYRQTAYFHSRFIHAHAHSQFAIWTNSPKRRSHLDEVDIDCESFWWFWIVYLIRLQPQKKRSKNEF